jgi:predicted carbohydrate-binding protein with CBM5 and CBM33 domain
MRAVGMCLLAVLAAPALAAAAGFGAADTAAIYKAAGFAMKGKTMTGCDAADPNWPRSSFNIEAIDLNADGKPEAVVSEGNVACYGQDEAGFTILARNPDGSWRKVGASTGGILPLKSRHNGWLDIQYGGPGMQRQPVLRFDGKAYK